MTVQVAQVASRDSEAASTTGGRDVLHEMAVLRQQVGVGVDVHGCWLRMQGVCMRIAVGCTYVGCACACALQAVYVTCTWRWGVGVRGCNQHPLT